MPQLLLQGFPDGTIKISPFLSILEKDGIRTYFTGADNYYSHPTGDSKTECFAIATSYFQLLNVNGVG